MNARAPPPRAAPTLPPPWCGLSWNCNYLSQTKLTQLSILTSPSPIASGPPPSQSSSPAPGTPPEPRPPRAVAVGVDPVPDGPPDPWVTSKPPDFIALTETKRLSLTTGSASDQLLSLPGYQLEWQPANRTGIGHGGREGVSGGLMLFIRSSLPFVRIPSLCNPHCLFVKLGLPGSRTHTILGVVYHRVTDPSSWKTIRSTIAAALVRELPVVILGDFNASHLSWCTKVTPAGNKLSSFCTKADLTILNRQFCPRQPTWHGKNGISSTIDLALASHPESIASLAPVPLLLSSDHLPLLLVGAPCLPRPTPSSPASRPPHYRWCSERADWSLFAQFQDDAAPRLFARLEAARCEAAAGEVSMQQSIDRQWLLLRDFVFDAAMIAVGRKRCGRTDRSQWFRRVPGVREANREFHRAHRLHCRRKTPESLAALTAARKLFRSVAALAKQKVWDDLCARIEKSGDSKSFWANYYATVGQPSLPVVSVHHPSSGLPLDPADARNHLAAHFSEACSPFPHTTSSKSMEEGIRAWRGSVKRDEKDNGPPCQFSVELVTKYCKRAKLSSAMGVDELSPWFLARGSESFYKAFTALVNYSYDHGVLPSDWRCANVCALFKGNGADSSSPDSFRPISLTSVACKVMERLVLSVIRTTWSPSIKQSGFRSGHSTYDLHYRLRRIIERTSRSRSYRHIAFLDFSKAFDKVDHQFLLYKLHEYAKIRGRPFRWIEAFLSNRALRVVSDSRPSAWFPVTAGVPQGAVVSPELFLIYIDDIVRRIEKLVDCLLYADDIALPPLLPGVFGDHQLRKALVICNKWARTWRMLYNLKKSQIVRFTRLRPDSEKLTKHIAPFPLGASNLAIVPYYKYLGILYDSRTTWLPQFESLYLRASRVSYLISRIVAPESPVTIRSVRSLILGMLLPLMTYAAPFWRLTKPQHNKLNALLTRPLLRTLRLPPTTHRRSLLVECAIPDIRTEWEKLTLTFVSRCLKHSPRYYVRSDHPSVIEIRAPVDSTVPSSSLVPTSQRIAREWGLDWGKLGIYGSRRIASRATSVQTRRWRAEGKCTDLLNLRDIFLPDRRQLPGRVPARYLLIDDRHTASLRARLRFNRSHLNESQHRRHIIPSPACSCGEPNEDVRHLLFCPLYRSIRQSLPTLLRPPVRPYAVDVLLGELLRLYRGTPEMTPWGIRRPANYGHHRYIARPDGTFYPAKIRRRPQLTTLRTCRQSLAVSGQFLRAVAEARPGSL